jgi:hypothetical protein
MNKDSFEPKTLEVTSLLLAACFHSVAADAERPPEEMVASAAVSEGLFASLLFGRLGQYPDACRDEDEVYSLPAASR